MGEGRQLAEGLQRCRRPPGARGLDRMDTEEPILEETPNPTNNVEMQMLKAGRAARAMRGVRSELARLFLQFVESRRDFDNVPRPINS